MNMLNSSVCETLICSPTIGLLIRVAFLPVAPWVQDVAKTSTGYQIGGMCYYLVKTLSELLNFTVVPVTPKDGGFGLFINGTWNGMVGMLIKNGTDMIIGPLAVGEMRARYIQYVEGYFNTQFNFLASSGKTGLKSFFSFLLTFDDYIWCGLLTLFLCLVVSSAFCDVYEKNDRGYNFFMRERLYVYFWIYLGSLFCEGSPRHPPTRRSQLLLSLWLLAVLVLMNGFCSSFKAALMVQGEEEILYTVKDIADRPHIQTIIPANSLYEELFRSSHQESFQRIYKRAKENPADLLQNTSSALGLKTIQDVKDGKSILVYSADITKSYLSKLFSNLTGSRRFYFVQESFHPHQQAFAVRKNFPKGLLYQINQRIKWVKEAGIVNKWMDELNRDYWKVEHDDDSAQETPLGTRHLLPVFYMLYALQACCLVGLGWEYASHYLSKKSKKKSTYYRKKL